jgi:hypothetical protein
MKTLVIVTLFVVCGCVSPLVDESDVIALDMQRKDVERILAAHGAKRSDLAPWTSSITHPHDDITYLLPDGRLLTLYYSNITGDVFGIGLAREAPDGEGYKGFTDRMEVHEFTLGSR